MKLKVKIFKLTFSQSFQPLYPSPEVAHDLGEGFALAGAPVGTA